MAHDKQKRPLTESAAFVCINVWSNLCLKKSDGQVLAALSTAASQHLTTVLGSHALQKAMNAAALTLLRLESLLHFVFPPSKFPQYWAFFGDLRLANARRYRGSLADLDYSARTASLSIANGEKVAPGAKAAPPPHRTAAAGRENLRSSTPVRCGFCGIPVQSLHILAYFQLLLRILWKIVAC